MAAAIIAFPPERIHRSDAEMYVLNELAIWERMVADSPAGSDRHSIARVVLEYYRDELQRLTQGAR